MQQTSRQLRSRVPNAPQNAGTLQRVGTSHLKKAKANRKAKLSKPKTLNTDAITNPRSSVEGSPATAATVVEGRREGEGLQTSVSDEGGSEESDTPIAHRVQRKITRSTQRNTTQSVTTRGSVNITVDAQPSPQHGSTKPPYPTRIPATITGTGSTTISAQPSPYQHGSIKPSYPTKPLATITGTGSTTIGAQPPFNRYGSAEPLYPAKLSVATRGAGNIIDDAQPSSNQHRSSQHQDATAGNIVSSAILNKGYTVQLGSAHSLYYIVDKWFQSSTYIQYGTAKHHAIDTAGDASFSVVSVVNSGAQARVPEPAHASNVFIATGTIKKNQSKPMPDFSERLRAPPVYDRQFDENTTVRCSSSFSKLPSSPLAGKECYSHPSMVNDDLHDNQSDPDDIEESDPTGSNYSSDQRAKEKRIAFKRKHNPDYVEVDSVEEDENDEDEMREEYEKEATREMKGKAKAIPEDEGDVDDDPGEDEELFERSGLPADDILGRAEATFWFSRHPNIWNIFRKHLSLQEDRPDGNWKAFNAAAQRKYREVVQKLPSKEQKHLKEVWLQEIGNADNMERVPPVTLMKQLTQQLNKAAQGIAGYEGVEIFTLLLSTGEDRVAAQLSTLITSCAHARAMVDNPENKLHLNSLIDNFTTFIKAANTGLINPSTHSLSNLLPMSSEESVRDGIHNHAIHPSWWEQAHSERSRDWARRVCARRMADQLDIILDTAGMRDHHRNGRWGGFLYTAIQQRIQLVNWPAEVPFPNTRRQMNGLSSDMVIRLRECMFNPKSELHPAFQMWSEEIDTEIDTDDYLQLPLIMGLQADGSKLVLARVKDCTRYLQERHGRVVEIGNDAGAGVGGTKGVGQKGPVTKLKKRKAKSHTSVLEPDVDAAKTKLVEMNPSDADDESTEIRKIHPLPCYANHAKLQSECTAIGPPTKRRRPNDFDLGQEARNPNLRAFHYAAQPDTYSEKPHFAGEHVYAPRHLAVPWNIHNPHEFVQGSSRLAPVLPHDSNQLRGPGFPGTDIIQMRRSITPHMANAVPLGRDLHYMPDRRELVPVYQDEQYQEMTPQEYAVYCANVGLKFPYHG